VQCAFSRRHLNRRLTFPVTGLHENKDKDDVDLMLIDSFLAGLSDGEH
jgi:hypothetical protein